MTLIKTALLLLIASILYGADTTYAPTKAVKKKSTKSIHTSPSKKESQTNSSSSFSSAATTKTNSSSNKTFFGDCLCNDEPLKDFSDLGVRIIAFPFKLIFCSTVYGIGKSYANLFTGKRRFHKQPNRVRFGGSFGLGPHFTPELAGGVQFDFSGYMHLDITNHTAFRQRIGFRPSAMGIYSDFQREVFVDDSSIGYQYDRTSDYRTMNLTASTELLFIPKGKKGTFYILAGGGAVFRSESVSIERTEEYRQNFSEFSLKQKHWAPGVSAGFGRQFTFAGINGFFELVYYGTFNSNNGELSLPSDNSAMTHSILMSWGFGN